MLYLMGRYDPAKHGQPLVCPECKAENAPANTDKYTERCHECGFSFETPVSIGDEVTVEITDIHESGRGVGRLDSGFIVLVSGALPTSDDTTVREVDVEVTRVRDNYAESDTVLDSRTVDATQDDEDETEAETDDDSPSEETDEEDEDPRLGSRRDFWGNRS